MGSVWSGYTVLYTILAYSSILIPRFDFPKSKNSEVNGSTYIHLKLTCCNECTYILCNKKTLNRNSDLRTKVYITSLPDKLQEITFHLTIKR